VDKNIFTKSIFYEDPLSESDKISMLVTVIKHGDDMAALYQAQYGKEWTTDADYDATTENAGWLWVKKFARANLVYVDGGDVITDAIGNLTMTEDAGIGNNSFSKLRDTIDGVANQWYCEGLNPLGTSAPTYIGIAAFAPHPNAAKLYIRFSLTPQGAAPWWGVMGDWPSRSDVPPAEGAPSFADVTLWPDDGTLMWEIGSQVRDFWTINLGK
jgi:iron(III) transport system substrate-binding protein